jgi:hypothetical protein
MGFQKLFIDLYPVYYMEQRKTILLAITAGSIIIALFIPVLDTQSGGDVVLYEEAPHKTAYEAEEQEIAVEESGFALRTRFALERSPVDRWMSSFTGAGASVEQKLIKSSHIYIEVEDYQGAYLRIKEIVSSHSGYIADTSEKDDEGRKYGYVVVRVPKEHFEDTTEEIKTLGEVEEARTTVEDVTEEYVDLEARLENLKKQEERYQEILAAAVTVEEILEIEAELERVRGEIESYEGKIRYLNDSIEYSSIQVSLTEPGAEKIEIGLIDALRRALQAFFAALRAVIIFLGYFLPVIITCGVLYYVGRIVYRKYFRGQ